MTDFPPSGSPQAAPTEAVAAAPVRKMRPGNKPRRLRTNAPAGGEVVPVPQTRAELVALLDAYGITGKELAAAHGVAVSNVLAIRSPRRAGKPMRAHALRGYHEAIKAVLRQREALVLTNIAPLKKKHAYGPA